MPAPSVNVPARSPRTSSSSARNSPGSGSRPRPPSARAAAHAVQSRRGRRRVPRGSGARRPRASRPAGRGWRDRRCGRRLSRTRRRSLATRALPTLHGGGVKARPRPRSTRPGCRAATVPNCSAAISGLVVLSSTAPDPTRMRDVRSATRAARTAGTPTRRRATGGARRTRSGGTRGRRRGSRCRACRAEPGRPSTPRSRRRGRGSTAGPGSGAMPGDGQLVGGGHRKVLCESVGALGAE